MSKQKMIHHKLAQQEKLLFIQFQTSWIWIISGLLIITALICLFGWYESPIKIPKEKIEKKAFQRDEDFWGMSNDEILLLRELEPKQLKILNLFQEKENASSREVRLFLNQNSKISTKLCQKWVESGFWKIISKPKTMRVYQLTEKYERLVQNSVKFPWKYKLTPPNPNLKLQKLQKKADN